MVKFNIVEKGLLSTGHGESTSCSRQKAAIPKAVSSVNAQDQQDCRPERLISGQRQEWQCAKRRRLASKPTRQRRPAEPGCQCRSSSQTHQSRKPQAVSSRQPKSIVPTVHCCSFYHRRTAKFIPQRRGVYSPAVAVPRPSHERSRTVGSCR